MVEEARVHIGARIKRLREGLGLSQSALARLLEEDRRVVFGWESGRISPRIEKLPAIADALRCTIDELFDHRLVQGELPGLDAPAAPPPEPSLESVPIRQGRSRQTASCVRRAPRRARGAA